MKKIRLLALLLAVITAGALFYYLSLSSDKAPEVPKSNVIVAAADIAENTVITPEMLKLVTVPTDTVLPNTYSGTSEIVGKTASAKIMAGEQVVSIRLVDAGKAENSTLTYAIAPGMRAITIGVGDTSSLKYMVKPNDTVDIIGQYQLDTETVNAKGETENKSIPTAVLLLQKIKVLAVDQVMQKTGADKYTTITLEVTPEQAVKVSFSENVGLLRLILRSPLDTATVEVKDVTIKDIVGQP